MIELYKKNKSLLVKFWFIRLVFYPITFLIINPIVFILSLKNTILILSKYPEYSMSSWNMSFVSFFYHRVTLLFEKYGRNGVAFEIGLGQYNLGNLFHYNLMSLKLYKKSPNFTVLLTMMFWLFTHFIWHDSIDIDLLIILILLTMVSSLFFVNIFILQNYNSVGWMFFPLFLFYLSCGNYFLVLIFALLISFGSITITILTFCYALLFFFLDGYNFFLLFAMIPSAIKFLYHIFMLISSKKPSKKNDKYSRVNSFFNILKIIGVTKKNVKYIRKKELNIIHYYFFLLSVIFFLTNYFLIGCFDWLFFVTILIFIINSFKFRFADNQSMYMLFLSCGLYSCIQNPHYLLIISFWLLISPLPFLLGSSFLVGKNSFDFFPVVKPLYLNGIMEDLREFIKPVFNGDVVLMSYNDPLNDYRQIFSPFRDLQEPLLYLISQKGARPFPDWFSVMETNYLGSENFWGVHIDEIKENIYRYNADYVIVHLSENNPVSKEEYLKQFELVSEFDWLKYSNLFDGTYPYLPEWKNERIDFISLPKWILLKNKIS